MKEQDLKKVKGGSRKEPYWEKWANGIDGLIGEIAEPGSVHWKKSHHR